MIWSRIIGTGSYLPEKVVTNGDLAMSMETTDEWIRSRTGIRQRHVAAQGQNCSDLAHEASKRALASAGIAPADVDLIIVATSFFRVLPVCCRRSSILVGVRHLIFRLYAVVLSMPWQWPTNF